MKNKTIIISYFIFFLSSINITNGQNITKLYENKHHVCLDSGFAMAQCSQKYYEEMDSLLNIVYKKLMLKLTDSEKRRIRVEQRNWIVKRDSYFKQTNKEMSKELGEGNMSLMIKLGKFGDFVGKRVNELYRQLIKLDTNK